MKIGSCVKWIAEEKVPITRGIVKGGSDKILDKAAIRAANVIFFILLKFKTPF